MDTDFTQKMTEKSDESLIDLINNRARYMPEAIEAAVAELQKRGHAFTTDELAAINEDIAKKHTALITEEHSSWNNGGDATTSDTDLVLYSDRAIYVFAILFSSLFGSVLLAMNIKKTGNKKGIAPVITFGIIYSLFVTYIVSLFTKSGLISLALNIAGAIILKYLFWDRYIGKATRYKARPIWAPLLIGVAIVVLFLTLIFLVNAVPQKR